MYESVIVYSTQGDFIGYAIKKNAVPKLQSINLYAENELPQLEQQLARLNGDVALKASWPDARDPDVVMILNDPNFMPIEMEEQEGVDEANSQYVYFEDPEIDILTGQPTGAMVKGDIDWDRSVVNYKRMLVPKRPSDVMERTKAACEMVARRRAGV